MGKKCIPGVICIENMTLFIMIVIFIMVIYLYYTIFVKPNSQPIYSMNQQLPSQSLYLVSPTAISDPLVNLYAPPLKNDGIFYNNNNTIDIRGQPNISQSNISQSVVPINVQTRGYNQSYSQMGILTRSTGGDMILPLMGRRIMSGRNKLQYYTMSNTGNLNTKLPISVNGKSCSGEYGCDEMSNGDIVYVEGYNDTFRATIYENSLFSYLPV
jgi:hypothetical protein